MAYTVVSFHAHPDDEALLTAGTLARAAAEGHRVVLVVATAGGRGLTATDGDIAAQRVRELQRSAAALGCAGVRLLGYDDSGIDGLAPGGFARADVDEAAARLADLLRAEAADVLTIYDPAGGYGHPDHVQVHVVGARAAELAGTPVTLEATVDRRALLRVLRLVHLARRVPPDWEPARFADAYTAHERLTHRVDVRRFAERKRAAMAAHVTQASGGSGPRTLAVFLRLPPWLFRRVFGYEWFVERGREPSGRLIDDVFASLRDRDRPPC